MAAADSSRIVREAEAYRQRRGVLAQADADRFVTQLESTRRSPRVFRARAYLHSLSRALAGSRKYIIGAEAPHEVLQFNFEDKLSSDLFDFSPIPDSEKGKDL
jgi:membrane protease subunit HflK